MKKCFAFIVFCGVLVNPLNVLAAATARGSAPLCPSVMPVVQPFLLAMAMAHNAYIAYSPIPSLPNSVECFDGHPINDVPAALTEHIPGAHYTANIASLVAFMATRGIPEPEAQNFAEFVMQRLNTLFGRYFDLFSTEVRALAEWRTQEIVTGLSLNLPLRDDGVGASFSNLLRIQLEGLIAEGSLAEHPSLPPATPPRVRAGAAGSAGLSDLDYAKFGSYVRGGFSSPLKDLTRPNSNPRQDYYRSTIFPGQQVAVRAMATPAAVYLDSLGELFAATPLLFTAYRSPAEHLLQLQTDAAHSITNKKTKNKNLRCFPNPDFFQNAMREGFGAVSMMVQPDIFGFPGCRHLVVHRHPQAELEFIAESYSADLTLIGVQNWDMKSLIALGDIEKTVASIVKQLLAPGVNVLLLVSMASHRQADELAKALIDQLSDENLKRIFFIKALEIDGTKYSPARGAPVLPSTGAGPEDSPVAKKLCADFTSVGF